MKNIAASIRDRLMNQARATGKPFAALLERFVIGRLLWRLSNRDARRFVLKGAQLFALWSSEIHRPTRDLDLLWTDDSSPEQLQAFFTALLAAHPDPEDGLIWGQVNSAAIREEQRYGGARITFRATLAGAVVTGQVDIGFGDAISPAPVEMLWRDLLDFPEARLLTYPPETFIAEKLHAAVDLGMDNSRMKDFFDLHWISWNREFDSAVLSRAIQATFARRQTSLPVETPVALTKIFASDASKVTQWNAFLRKNRLSSISLEEVVDRLHGFLQPVLVSSGHLSQSWDPKRGWVSLLASG